MRIAIVIGTRPEIIKMSPVIRYCENNHIDYFVIHTGQHYSYNMDKIFFEELELSQPKYQLNIKSSAPFLQGQHTGKMVIKIEEILLEERPDILICHGDTNSCLAGALAAVKLSTTKEYTSIYIKTAHVESGLRSYDRSMPEEINRVIVDQLSDVLFVPSEIGFENLKKEGLNHKNIFITGNTIVDAISENLKISKNKCNVLDDFKLKSKEYILVTAHRQESVDIKERLENILKGIDLVAKEAGLRVIYPMHPRTKKEIEKFDLIIPDSIEVVEPVGFLEFLQLEEHAKLIMTDSGGMQEESCILRVPCVTLRQNTERPETVDIGANIVAGYDSNKILECAKIMLKKDTNWKNPFGKIGLSGDMINILDGLSVE